jgi:hypothetical protein
MSWNRDSHRAELRDRWHTADIEQARLDAWPYFYDYGLYCDEPHTNPANGYYPVINGVGGAGWMVTPGAWLDGHGLFLDPPPLVSPDLRAVCAFVLPDEPITATARDVFYNVLDSAYVEQAKRLGVSYRSIHAW